MANKILCPIEINKSLTKNSPFGIEIACKGYFEQKALVVK